MLNALMVEPPVTMESPNTVYTVFYWLFVAQLVPAIGFLLFRAWRQRDGIPVGVLLGALAIGYLSPPILNHLTMVWFPSNIPFAYITAFGMRDPFFDWMGYALFYGIGGFATYTAIRRGGGVRAVYVTAGVWALADLLYEIPFLHFGMYTYYGNQPFEIGGFPLHWVVVNAMVPVITAVLLYLLVDKGTYPKRPWLRALGAAPVAGVITVGAVMPVSVALHADAPTIVIRIAAVATIVLAGSVIVVCAGMAKRFGTECEPARATAATGVSSRDARTGVESV